MLNLNSNYIIIQNELPIMKGCGFDFTIDLDNDYATQHQD